jgi:adenosine deaminase
VALPKAEVHVHLEGSFSAEDVAMLAEEAGAPLPRPPSQLFDVGNLADFLARLDWSCALVRTEEQLSRAAYRLAQREHASGAGYADVIVNPTHWPAWKGRLGEMVAALDDGFSRAERDGWSPIGLCLSLLRQQSAEDGMALVGWMAKAAPGRVVALSVDGDEGAAGRTGPRFAPAFAAARAAGFRCTAHAGESSGPEGVWDAIDVLKADRVDHGVRAVEDPHLVRALAERGVPLNVCPSSNIKLGVYRSYEEHPLKLLRQAGVRVTVNTDDPALIGTRLEWEYARAGAAAGWGTSDYLQLAAASVDAAFCSGELKSRLHRQIAAVAATLDRGHTAPGTTNGAARTGPPTQEDKT